MRRRRADRDVDRGADHRNGLGFDRALLPRVRRTDAADGAHDDVLRRRPHVAWVRRGVLFAVALVYQDYSRRLCAALPREEEEEEEGGGGGDGEGE